MYRKRFILLTILFLLLGCSSNGNTSTQKFNVYFFNPTKNIMAVEKVTMELNENTSKNDLIYQAIHALYSGPVSKNLQRVVPVEVIVSLQNGIATIELSPDYDKLIISDQIILRSSLVYTVTDFDFVNGVQFLVGDEPLKNNNGIRIGVLDRNNIGIGAMDPNPPTTRQLLILYFRKEGTNELVPEIRDVQVNQDVPIEQYIIEELIKGPSIEGLEPTLPKTTIINAIKVQDTVFQIDLTYEKQAKELTLPEGETLLIYSIVNSVTEIGKIQKVSFLMNGEEPDSIGEIDFSILFERNEDLIAQ
ncbi:hypothetical protein AN639_00685 [Candidatus Epulonipiscium fishelsonii]|uniref:Uncharacterized protein n=1 Tax=Candidatus Epulonipiscium fishelsonii TaxID=77094 RepID=A0ACC8X7R9_9FIRM|nr:hypothetical protein AN396_12470 [Epulopiscium sp. SCG-B11WGA-EpuloA1]ONI41315.1 hypothetical protein AN639_00685 [Epulopiscium sp. SCG-B05WGA-EpuloA1]